MMPPSSKVLKLAESLRDELAGRSITPAIARLYSQHTRLQARGTSLLTWRQEEAVALLYDAERLIQAALIQRDVRDANWNTPMLRAAELLEWLSHPESGLDPVPLPLLAAAAYQIAGYPARAAGILTSVRRDGDLSVVLAAFLAADFPVVLELLAREWPIAVGVARTLSTVAPWKDPGASAEYIGQWLTAEALSAIGVIAGHMRWGDTERAEKAVNKLMSIARAASHGHDPYSWLLASLTADVAATYVAASLRHHLTILHDELDNDGRVALERYTRQAFLSRRSLVWPSQERGIQALQSGNSFALCTPTGSGKTTIAELAILQSLFQSNGTTSSSQHPSIPHLMHGEAPLAAYLVPTRALAAEVEGRLSRTFRTLSDRPVIVTGLYGGTDWGPTDAWLTSDDKTVVICTYEKTEALLRYFGPRLLQRLALVIIDEAHGVQHDRESRTLVDGDDRHLRLEWLTTRLIDNLQRFDRSARIIALSAVAGSSEQALVRWVTGNPNSQATTTSYQSTRQLIGRLECAPNRHFEIFYDLMDGSSLRLSGADGESRPYVPNPFPQCPVSRLHSHDGVEKRLRPFVVWAAMHSASPDADGRRRSVLVFITQQIGGFAEDVLNLLDRDWLAENLPSIFDEPTDYRLQSLWDRCKRSCEDYFGIASREYRLLERGIVVHHGRMPGQLARLLVEVIEARVCRLVIATSTLSEGVNLPFEVVLIPTLRRGTGSLTVSEFRNLTGRAGRPGQSTEGRTLVLLERPPANYQARFAEQRYWELLEDHGRAVGAAATSPLSQSPLAQLLDAIWQAWQGLSGSQSFHDFLGWLEITSPSELQQYDTDSDDYRAITGLDSLDGLLLAALVEIERVQGEDLSGGELEARLKAIWQRTYAAQVDENSALHAEILATRGVALKERIFPDARERRRLYSTSLPPRSARELLSSYPDIVDRLRQGTAYAKLDPQERFNFIRDIVEALGSVRKFRPVNHGTRRNVPWTDVLHWWLDPRTCPIMPRVAQVSDWHRHASDYFVYRFNWGLGSIIALAIDETFGDELDVPPLERWPETGLPWIAFWLKELMIWGTLEPVAALLLAHGVVTTRVEAEELAGEYYDQIESPEDDNEIMSAVRIREWVEGIGPRYSSDGVMREPVTYPATRLRDFSKVKRQLWRVIPVKSDEVVRWFDVAGYALAETRNVEAADTLEGLGSDFFLDPGSNTVVRRDYI